jgi:hypothetical protein
VHVPMVAIAIGLPCIILKIVGMLQTDLHPGCSRSTTENVHTIPLACGFVVCICMRRLKVFIGLQQTHLGSVPDTFPKSWDDLVAGGGREDNGDLETSEDDVGACPSLHAGGGETTLDATSVLTGGTLQATRAPGTSGSLTLPSLEDP